MCGERKLRGQRGSDGLASGWEGDEERVTLRVHLVSASLRERLAQQPTMLVEHPLVAIAELQQQPRRALDVREQERHGPGRPRVEPAELERRVLVEDLALEPVQSRPRVDPQFFGQSPSALLVRVQGARLPPAAIERQHELGAQALAKRIAGDEVLELGDDFGVAAERQLSFDPLLRCCQTKFLQPKHVHVGERVVAEVGQRVAAEERERIAQQLGATCGLLFFVRLLDKRFEAADVDALACEPEDVPRRTGLDRVMSEQLAQSGDMPVQRGLRRLGWRRAPERLDELFAGHDVVHVE